MNIRLVRSAFEVVTKELAPPIRYLVPTRKRQEHLTNTSGRFGRNRPTSTETPKPGSSTPRRTTFKSGRFSGAESENDTSTTEEFKTPPDSPPPLPPPAPLVLPPVPPAGMSGGGSTAIAATTMSTAENGELKFTVKNFDGKRENYPTFEASAAIYLKLNDKKYDSNEKKILWVLGHLQEGTASTWRTDYLRTHVNTAGDFDLSKEDIVGFMKELKAAFYSTTEETDAENELKTLKQDTMPAEEFITEFELLCGRAHITDDKHKIDLLKTALNQRLLSKIVYSEDPPKSYADWKTKVIRFDQNWRLAQAMLGRPVPKNKNSQNTGPRYSGPRYTNRYNQGRTSGRDPSAMDIDVMTTDERYTLLRKGACFNCKQTGHMAKDCPKKRNNPTRSDKPWWNDQGSGTGNRQYAESSNGSTASSGGTRKFNKESARKFIREIEWENDDEKEAFLNEYDPEDF